MSQDSDIDYEQARLDPGAVFGTPEALRDLGGLLREQKIDILRRWAYDAAELNVAEEEGMQDGESACAADILVVLDTSSAVTTSNIPRRPGSMAFRRSPGSR